MQVIRLPRWGFDIQGASYYGWLVAIHIGPWLVLWKMTYKEGENDG